LGDKIVQGWAGVGDKIVRGWAGVWKNCLIRVGTKMEFWQNCPGMGRIWGSLGQHCPRLSRSSFTGKARTKLIRDKLELGKIIQRWAGVETKFSRDEQELGQI
jgi:hypothetical protein